MEVSDSSCAGSGFKCIFALVKKLRDSELTSFSALQKKKNREYWFILNSKKFLL
jgi:hypothetical protein